MSTTTPGVRAGPWAAAQGPPKTGKRPSFTANIRRCPLRSAWLDRKWLISHRL